jgi:hypothetical protein
MPRKFITERDIAAYAAEGLNEVVIGPDTTLTDMARERARAAKIRLVQLESSVTTTVQPPEKGTLHARVRAAVVAQLGSEPKELDLIIAEILKKVS